MANRKNINSSSSRRILSFGIGAALLAGVLLAVVWSRSKSGDSFIPRTNAPGAASAALPSADRSPRIPVPLPTMPVNEAVMVTVELDFGPKIPSIADALTQIERRYQPDDGVGRTFAILDAYGEPTPDGKKLHVSMHVSSEKPGVAGLVFKRNGEYLWQTRILESTNSPKGPFNAKSLMIYLTDDGGKTWTIDGSSSPASILEATIKELGVPVSMAWPDLAERELTFIYSACGCPVKVLVKRVGDQTVRTKDLPVMFPDDPAVMTVIRGLMKW